MTIGPVRAVQLQRSKPGRAVRAALLLLVLTGRGTHAIAQDRDLGTFSARIEVLYATGDEAAQVHCVDSVLASVSATPSARLLVKVVSARLERSRGEARAALTSLNTLAVDTVNGDPIALCAYANERARALKQLGLYPRALEEVERALRTARSHGLATQEINALTAKSEVERRIGKVDVALALLLEAEKLAVAHGYELGQCNVLINRGNILYNQDRYKEALRVFQATRECALSHGFTQLAMNAVFNEASALSMVHPDSVEAAISVYENALRDTLISNDRRHQADLYGAISMMYRTKDRFVDALAAIDRSIAILGELHDTLSQAQQLVTRASVLRKTGRLEPALEDAMSALALSRSNHSLEIESNALMEVSRILHDLGRDQDANDRLTDYIAVDDSLEKRTYGERIVDMEFKYELEKKEARIAEAEATSRRRGLQLIAIALISSLLVVVLGLVVRNVQHLRKGQTQTRLLHEQRVNDLLKQQEIRSLDAMMHGQQQERERVGKDLHDRLGTMLSTIRLRFSALQGRLAAIEARQDQRDDQAFKLLDDAVAEVRRISHDIVRGSLAEFGLAAALEDLCETLRVPGKMEAELGIFGLDQRLDGKLEIAVYRMVQEAVGNALKHAQASEISVQVNRAPASLNVIVEDNGTGFDPARMKEGLGMGNLRERAAAFGGVVSVDSRPGHGTTVTVDIPLAPLSST